MFDISKVKVEDNFAPLATGWYGAHVNSLEWKISKAGAEYLNVQYKLDTGRVVFAMFNLFSPNETAKNIAMGSVKKALIASGFTEDKLNFPNKEALAAAMAMVNCEIYLTIKKSDEYGDKNEVKNYKKRESVAPAIDTTDLPF